MKKKERILVCCAQIDDAHVGMGGTIAAYAAAGAIVKTLVFTYGELSQAHLDPELVRKMKEREAHRGDDILCGRDVTFLGVREDKLATGKLSSEDYDTVEEYVSEFDPDKIFTHSLSDPQPTHRAVTKIMRNLTREGTTLYGYEVWNPVRLRHRRAPQMVVEIKDHMAQKIKAVDAHKSQHRIVLAHLMKLRIYIRAFFTGLNSGLHYAESFTVLN